jgi:autotransporter-associated beta strand protein
MRIGRRRSCRALAIGVGLASAAGAAAPSFGYNSLASQFTLVTIPDPQYYAVVQWKNDQYYAGQMNWIVNNATSKNIGYVFGLGDNVQDGNPYTTNADGSIGTTYTGNIVPQSGSPAVTGAPSINTVDPTNHNFESEWIRAAADWNILSTANIPHYTVIGNHDYYHWDQKKDPSEWNKYFAASMYSGKSWFTGGLSPADSTQATGLRIYSGLNAYNYFYAGGYKFLNIGLQFVPTAGDIAWAQSIINANKGIPTIVSTHDYQDTNGRDAAGNNLWNNFISKAGNSQIFMVLSGHVNGVHQQISTDADGKGVFEILSDYQDYQFSGLQNGGGYLRTMLFDTAADTIHVQTYSPVANNFLTTGSGATANDFTLNFDFAARFGPPPLATGQNYYWDPGHTNSQSGGGAGAWDASTNANWCSGSADVMWSTTGASDAAVFGGASGGAVTIAAAGISVNDMVFNATGYSLSGGTITLTGSPTITTPAGGSVTIANVLAGSAGVTVKGGTVTFSAANTYTGGTTITNGATLVFTADNNLGASGQPITIDGGTLSYNGTVNGGTTISPRAITIGGNDATINVPNPGPGFGGQGKLVFNTGATISGAGDITKTGPGWLTVYTNNAGYGGNWTVNAGVLELGNTNAAGTGNITINNGGEVGVNITTAIANPVTVNTGATLGADFFNTTNTGTFSGPITASGNFNVRLGAFYSGYSQKVLLSGNISGNGALTTIGPAMTPVVNASQQQLTLSGDNSLFTGGIVIPTGTVAVGATAGKPLGTGPVTLSGGRLALQGQAVQSGAAQAVAPVNVTGFNKDVIYGLPDANGTTTTGIDNVFSFYQTNYIPPTGTLNAGTEFTTGGLDGTDITSAAAGGANTPFSLQSFTANNTLQFAQGSTGTLALKVPSTFTKLAILATSSFANEDTPNVTIHFTDGTTAVTTYKAYDWSMGTDALRQNASAFGASGINRYSPTQSPGWDQRPFGMYETDIDMTNINGVDYSMKQVDSITFNATSSDTQNRGKSNVFAVSGAARAWVTSTTSQIYSNTVSVTADSSIDISGNLVAALGALSVNAAKLSVTSADTTTNPYSLTFGATTLTGATTVDVAASIGGGPGTVVLGNLSGSGSLTKTNAGTLKLAGTSNILGGNLAINGGTTQLVPTNTTSPSTLTIAALTFSGTGKLDLTNNELITTSSQAALQLQLLNGTLFTSITGNGGAIGFLDLGNGTREARYTLLGDTNLDGQVNVADLANLAGNFGATAGQFWINGDFDNNGQVNVADLADLAGNFGNTLSLGSAAATAAKPTSLSTGNASVPEPTTLGLLVALATAGLTTRRQRQTKTI